MAFILAHERGAVLRFAAQAAPVGRQLLRQYALPEEAGQSVVLIERGQIFSSSTAALRICRYLRAPWRYASILRVVPRPLRDAVYRLIARHRRHLLAPDVACPLPMGLNPARFLDAAPESPPSANQR